MWLSDLGLMIQTRQRSTLQLFFFTCVIYMKIFPLAVFACRVVVARIWTMTMWVLSYCRFDPDDERFSLYLCMSLSYRLYKVVELTEWCACLNNASLNIQTCGRHGCVLCHYFIQHGLVPCYELEHYSLFFSNVRRPRDKGNANHRPVAPSSAYIISWLCEVEVRKNQQYTSKSW